jgi:hypothetical protein
MLEQYINNVLEESRYIQWNEGVREKEVLIWQSNCLARRWGDAQIKWKFPPFSGENGPIAADEWLRPMTSQRTFPGLARVR